MHNEKEVIIVTCHAETGNVWYALDNIEYLLPPLHLDESEI